MVYMQYIFHKRGIQQYILACHSWHNWMGKCFREKTWTPKHFQRLLLEWYNKMWSTQSGSCRWHNVCLHNCIRLLYLLWIPFLVVFKQKNAYASNPGSNKSSMSYWLTITLLCMSSPPIQCTSTPGSLNVHSRHETSFTSLSKARFKTNVSKKIKWMLPNVVTKV